jgi:hypothetical protein
MKSNLIIIILLLIFSINLHSALYITPTYLAETNKKLELGVELGFSIDKSYEVLSILEYPLIKRFSPILKIGYMDRKDYAKGFYVNFSGKIILFEKFGGSDFFSAIVGAHYCENLGIDTAILIGNIFKNFDNYIGCAFESNFLKDKNIYPGYFILGAKFPFKNNKLKILIEFNIPITNDYDYTLGVSLKY